MFRVAVASTLAFTVMPAHASPRATLRFGVVHLELEATRDTPIIGDDMFATIDQVNDAVDIFEKITGRMGMPRLHSSDIDLDETLYTVSPGIEFGGGRHHFFRFEVPIGFSDDLTAVGVGIYPINLQVQTPAGSALYLSLGGSASWLDRPGPGDIGGLLVARAAAGARFARHLTFEVGFSAFALGGTYNRDALAVLDREDLRHRPDELITAGEARGLVDFSLGLTF